MENPKKIDLQSTNKDNNAHKEKILLALLPFWDPQIPPLGISCLKSFLQAHGYCVKVVDTNIEIQFREIFDLYCNALIKHIPGELIGNFYNVVHEVVGNHLMSHLNYEDEKDYSEFMKISIEKTFFYRVDDQLIGKLEELFVTFYSRLESYFLQLLREEEPTVLGLSVYSDNLAPSMFVFKLTKKYSPQIKTVMGGGIFAEPLALGSPNLEFFLEKTPYIDKIIIGEGELLFLKWLKGQLNQSQRVYTIEDINGEYLDLAAVEIPDFSDFNLRHYPYIAAYGSRSCPFQCNFCSETVIWGKYRKKKAEKVVSELEKLYDLHHYQIFFMGDSLVNPIIDDLAQACISTGKSFYWDGFLRVDQKSLAVENTLRWRRGGFYRARIGLESGSQRILDTMNKKITLEQSRKTLINLSQAGIKTTTFWVIGYPGETEQDFQMTLDFIEQLNDYIYEADCNPFIYGITGQVNSAGWNKIPKKRLYPEKAKNMIILENWVLDCQPHREEIYGRVNRFMQHIDKLGIINPYTLHDVHKADERWQRLHKNAVPPLIDFRDKIYLDENKQVKELYKVKNTQFDDNGFGF